MDICNDAEQRRNLEARHWSSRWTLRSRAARRSFRVFRHILTLLGNSASASTTTSLLDSYTLRVKIMCVTLSDESTVVESMD